MTWRPAPTAAKRPSRHRIVAAVVGAFLAAVSPVSLPTAAHATGGTTYYVDSAAGSDANSGTASATPWQSLAKVDAQAFGPGDKILFKAGETWTGQLALHGSGSAGAPITVAAYGSGAKPHIDGAGTVTSAVLLDNEHDVTVDGLEVTNTSGANSTWRNGVEIAAQNAGALPGITVENMYIHNIEGPSGYVVSIGHGGILAHVEGNATPTYYTGMLLQDNEIANVSAYGIVTWSTWFQRDGWTKLWSDPGVPTTGYGAFTPSTGLVIRGNNVHDIGNGGISPNQADNVLIEHNTVTRTALQHGNVAIWWSGTDNLTAQYNDVSATHNNGRYKDDTAFDADESTYNSVVQYNFSHNNAGGFFETCSAATGYSEATVRDNISQDDYGDIFLLQCANAKQVYVYNNTVYASASPPASPLYGMVTNNGSNITGVVLHDNILESPLAATYSTSGITYWHNLYNGSIVPSGDAAPLTGNPLFKSADTATGIADVSGYLLQTGSPAIGTGHRAPGDGGRDLVADPLPTASPDMGALQSSTPVPTVTTSYPSGQNTTPAAIADHNPATSWTSTATGVAFPGTITLDYGQTQTLNSVTLATAYGQGQGITDLDVQTWNGTAWVTQLSDATLQWDSNTSLVEYRTLTMPATVTTSKVQLVIRTANLQWGNLAVNDLLLGGPTTPAPTVTSSYATGQGQLSNLVDTVPTTSWASPASGVTFPGTITLDYHQPLTVHSVTLATAFGQGQGITNLDVQTWNGTAWVTQVSGAALSWSSNTSTVETRTIALPTAVTTSKVQLVIHTANLQWGDFAVNDIAAN